MTVDAEHAALLVRITARISAALLAINLLAAAERIRRPNRSAFRRLDLGTFLALVVSHTVHFLSVANLAVATAGENVRARGGWTANLILGVLFYAGCLAIFGVKRRSVSQWVTARQRRTEVVTVTLIWAAFAQAYLSRLLQSRLFAMLAAGLVASLLLFYRSARRYAGRAALQSV